MYRAPEKYMNYISSSTVRKPKSKITVGDEVYTGESHLKTFPKIEHHTEAVCACFPIKTVEFEIYDTENSITFDDREISVMRGLDIDGDIIWVPMGLFRAEKDGITTNLTSRTVKVKAYDRAHRFDVPFNSEVHTFPCTLGEFVTRLCLNHDIQLESETFPFCEMTLNELPNFPEKISEREIICKISELSGSTAHISRAGGLIISQPEQTRAVISSGKYKSFSREKPTYITTLIISNAGVEDKVISDSDLIGRYGKYAYEIKDNPFIEYMTQEMLDSAAGHIIGLNVTPFKLTELIDDHIFDIGDRITVRDRSGVEIETTVLSLITQSRIKSDFSASVPKKESEVTLSGSTEEKISQSEDRANSYTDRLISAQKNMIEKMNNALGIYSTVISQGEARVYYFHDKPGIEESTYIFTFNSEGFAWAKGSGCWNGGAPHWQYGVDSQGGGILETLLVRKITADIIEAGVIKTLDGNTYFDLDNGEIYSFKSDYFQSGGFDIGYENTVKIKSGEVKLERMATTLDVDEEGNFQAKDTATSALFNNNSLDIIADDEWVHQEEPDEPTAPGRDDFNSLNEYLAALSDYILRRVAWINYRVKNKFRGGVRIKGTNTDGSEGEVILTSSGLSVSKIEDGEEITVKYDASGWVDIGDLLTENFSLTDSDAYCRVRKVCDVIYLQGIINASSGLSGSNLMFTLPEGFRPSERLDIPCCTGIHNWQLTITPDGRVSFSNLHFGNSIITTTENYRLPFNISFPLG